MANNTTVNKVVINNQTVLDLTDTTATAEDVANGEVFYSASGERTLGTAPAVLPVSKGGTGASTLTSGEALIGNGTSAVTTRGIRNSTTKGTIGWVDAYSNLLLTQNDIAFWDGRYADERSNLAWCQHGEIGNSATLSYENSLTNGSNLPTGKAVTDFVGNIINLTMTYTDSSKINTNYSWAQANPATREVKGQIWYSDAVTGSVSAFATMPSGYWPKKQCWFPAFGSNGGGYIARGAISTSGQISIVATGIPSDAGLSYGAFIPFNYFY